MLHHHNCLNLIVTKIPSYIYLSISFFLSFLGLEPNPPGIRQEAGQILYRSPVFPKAHTERQSTFHSCGQFRITSEPDPTKCMFWTAAGNAGTQQTRMPPPHRRAWAQMDSNLGPPCCASHHSMMLPYKYIYIIFYVYIFFGFPKDFTL